MKVFWRRKDKMTNNTDSIRNQGNTTATEEEIPVATRFNNIISGKTDSLSIREILEYYINEKQTGLCEYYDYYWSNFPEHFEMNLVDLLDIISVLVNKHVFQIFDIVDCLTVVSCQYGFAKEEGTENRILGQVQFIPAHEWLKKYDDFGQVREVLESLGYGEDLPAGNILKPLGYRPAGFDASYDITRSIVVAETIDGNKGGTTYLSASDILIWNCSALYAKRNLTKKEYEHFVKVYDHYYSQKNEWEADIVLYQRTHESIMNAFESCFPYTLIFTESAKDMTPEKERMFRNWYKKGIRGFDALDLLG